MIPNTDAIGRLNDMKPGFSLTLKYKKAEDWAALKNKEVRAYYMGMKEIPNKQGELVCCGMFVTENECFLSGQTTLIEAVRQLEPQTPISITYRERRTNKSNGDRSTMIFDVVKLQ